MRMAPLMLRKGRCLGEELPAYLALEWPMAGMTLWKGQHRARAITRKATGRQTDTYLQMP